MQGDEPFVSKPAVRGAAKVVTSGQFCLLGPMSTPHALAPTRLPPRPTVNARQDLGQLDVAVVGFAVGAAAVGDAIARWWYLPGSSGAGLRGGRFTVRGDPVVHLRLRGVRFVADATVDGTAT